MGGGCQLGESGIGDRGSGIGVVVRNLRVWQVAAVLVAGAFAFVIACVLLMLTRLLRVLF